MEDRSAVPTCFFAGRGEERRVSSFAGTMTLFADLVGVGGAAAASSAKRVDWNVRERCSDWSNFGESGAIAVAEGGASDDGTSENWSPNTTLTFTPGGTLLETLYSIGCMGTSSPNIKETFPPGAGRLVALCWTGRGGTSFPNTNDTFPPGDIRTLSLRLANGTSFPNITEVFPPGGTRRETNEIMINQI